MKKKMLVVLSLTVLSVPNFSYAQNSDNPKAPSFDCQKAGTLVEKLICGSQQLSEDDVALTTAYKAALGQAIDKSVLTQEQRKWLSSERNVCQDETCLHEKMQSRTAQLTALTGNSAMTSQVAATDGLKGATQVDTTSETKPIAPQQESVSAQIATPPVVTTPTETPVIASATAVASDTPVKSEGMQDGISNLGNVLAGTVVVLTLISLVMTVVYRKRVVYCRNKIDYYSSLAIMVVMILALSNSPIKFAAAMVAFLILQIAIGFFVNDKNIALGLISGFCRTFTSMVVGVANMIGGGQETRSEMLRNAANDVHSARATGKTREEALLRARASIEEKERRNAFYQKYIVTPLVLNYFLVQENKNVTP